VDFYFPTTPNWGGTDHMILAGKGSFGLGTGWEVQINDATFNGNYSIMMEANQGVGSYTNVWAYLVTPGAFHRALFVCDTTASGVWYVNGTASAPTPCAATASGATDLVIGKYSAPPADYVSTFPITRVQIWNRALTPAEGILSTTTDPTPSTVTFNGTIATPTSWSPGSIIAAVPSGATTGDIVVTAAGQASNGVPFTVTGGGAAPQSIGAESFSTFGLSGSITPLTAGAGAAVALTQTGQSTTADNSGKYAFTGLASGSYTVTPSKPGYVFAPGGQTVTVTNADVIVNFSGAMGPTSDRANSYDNAWETAWVAHARSLLTTSGKTNGFVLEIGDSITHSAAYANWPTLGQGQTAKDTEAIIWARGSTWGAAGADVTSKNGLYLAAADTTAQRGMTAASGLSLSELVSGCCNGGPAMAATSNPATARQLIANSTLSANIQIDTLIAAFSDAQFAVVMLGSNDPANPNNVAGLTAIVDRLEAQRIVPILTTIPPRSDGVPDSVIVQFNAAVTALARARSLPLIDFYQEILLRRPGNAWFGTLISGDGLHPTASGGGFTTLSDPYLPGGDAATSTTGDAASNVGYLLRSWLTVQKLKEVKQYVIDGVVPPF
jgi:hypothetical protein